MLKNYLVVAFRNLARHKGYTVLNVAGLAVGLAAWFSTLNSHYPGNNRTSFLRSLSPRRRGAGIQNQAVKAARMDPVKTLRYE